MDNQIKSSLNAAFRELLFSSSLPLEPVAVQFQLSSMKQLPYLWGYGGHCSRLLTTILAGTMLQPGYGVPRKR